MLVAQQSLRWAPVRGHEALLALRQWSNYNRSSLVRIACPGVARHFSHGRRFGKRQDAASPGQTLRGKPGTTANVAKLLNCFPNVSLDRSVAVYHSITVIRNDSKSTLEDLIHHLEPLAGVEAPDEPLLIIFATRSFAAEIYARQNLISAIVSKILGQISDRYESLQTLVAVVDKLPTLATTADRSESSSMQQFSTLDPGHEGLCISVSSTRTSGMTSLGIDNWSPESSRFTHSLSPETPATVICQFNPDVRDVSTNVLDPRISEQSDTINASQVEVPLTSTIFENGLHYTLLRSHFVRDWECKDYRCERTENVQHAQITLPFNPGVGKHHRATIGVPLQRLTGSFQIVDCKGNIIRRVQPYEQASQNTRPASEGLENAVSKYFSDRNIRPHALAVWALMVPRELLDLDENIRSSLRRYNAETANVLAQHKSHEEWLGSDFPRPLEEMFSKGAKLRRVTSGGGGWGNKAGLLSFDPETSYQTSSMSSEGGFDGFNLEDQDAFHTGLEPIAEKGDVVQFYLIPPELLDQSQLSASTELESAMDQSICQFGVIPSTIDDIPSVPEPSESSATVSAPQVFYDRFGALSERGISLRTLTYSGWKGESMRSHINSTKIDVPFAKFRIQGAERRPFEKAQDRNEHDRELPGTTHLGFRPTEPKKFFQDPHHQ